MKTKKDITPFENTVAFFKKHIDEVVVYDDKDDTEYKRCEFKGKGIVGGFCEQTDDDCWYYLNGRIAFDNIKCFDKWSRCPVSLPLLQNAKEENELLELIKFWGSEDGYNKSNGYDFEMQEEYSK